MEDIERIINAKNSVGPGFGPGKDNPNALSTKETSVYRVTGMDQVKDIINCGYVRPKGYGPRRERVGDKIYWSIGGEKLYYCDKRPVLEASIDKVKNDQMGAISLDNLTGIWIFDETQNKYVNNIQAVRNAYNQLHPIEDQINQLKAQIQVYDKQINELLLNIQPYMKIPKVNQEISKVIEKNNEINSSKIIDSLNDYKTVVDIKQSILVYLNQVDKFIKDNMSKKEESVVEQQVESQDQTESSEFWKEFEQQEQKQQQSVPNNFWDQFDNPNNTRNARPEKMYNEDGTYTMEYIAYLANTPNGFNQTIYDQLIQENEMKRKQNNSGKQM